MLSAKLYVTVVTRNAHFKVSLHDQHTCDIVLCKVKQCDINLLIRCLHHYTTTFMYTTGTLHKSLVDRFSIVLMAGIASEAISFGKAEGGASDESQLIDVLSSITPAFTYEQIKRQARWSAVQVQRDMLFF